MTHYAALSINGVDCAGAAGDRIEVLNPATEELLGAFSSASAQQVQSAIDAAQHGFEAWRSTAPWQRSRVLRQVGTLLRERQATIAAQISAEIGKPLSESNAEIQTSAEFFDWYADETRRIEGTMLPGRDDHSQIAVNWEPVGVVLALTAWNFPMVLAARKLAMALAAGCSVILRPADEAPACVAALVKCCIDAGLPNGTVNLLLGTPEQVVQPLIDSRVVRKVSFTGSNRVGQMLAAQCANTVKRLTMELGGHAPFIVMEDADVPRAAALAAAAKFRNAGQVCTSPSRFYVHESVREAFVGALAAHAKALHVGPPTDPASQMGPVATERQLLHCERLVADAVSKGATLLAGGHRLATPAKGYYFAPTVLDDVPPTADILRIEPFCPVAAVVGFEDRSEMIQRANALEAGLAAYLFSTSIDHVEFVTRHLECGVVGVNNTIVGLPETPFGGTKSSGYGREGSAMALRDYMSPKMVHRTW
jgi:succinate-semialdehyde dehydrogenase/glutarate-semialdehyde dehydrogenase